MKKILIILLFTFNCKFSFSEINNYHSVDLFNIGKMNSHDKKFTLYFKTRDKAILAKGEEYNYITDFPQDLYLFDHLSNNDVALISYDWFPNQAKKIIQNYDFPVFPEDFAYYLLKDNNTLIMVSAIKNFNTNLIFDISKKKLKSYNNKNKLEFIISSVVKKCGFNNMTDNYKCYYYKPLISSNLIN